jgi:hypothetical protein
MSPMRTPTVQSRSRNHLPDKTKRCLVESHASSAGTAVLQRTHKWVQSLREP